MKQLHVTSKIKMHKKWISIFSIEILFLFFMIYFVFPAFQWLMKKIISLAGYRFIADSNIKHVITNPVVIAGFFCIVTLLGLFFLLEEIALLLIIDNNRRNTRLKIMKRAFIRIFKLPGLLLLFGSILTSFVFHPIYLKLMVENFQLLSFMKNKVLGPNMGTITYIIIFVLTAIFGFFLFFLEYEYFIKAHSLKKSFQNTMNRIKNFFFQLLFSLFRSYLKATFFFASIYLILMLSGFLISHQSTPFYLRYGQWLTLMDAVNRSMIYFYNMFALSITFVVVVVFSNIDKKRAPSVHRIIWSSSKKEHSTILPIKKYRFHQRTLAPLYLSILILFFIFLINNKDFMMESRLQLGYQTGLEQPEIIAHRGNSSITPENTLVSILSAINAHADRTEIDVQMTYDGVLVLMHDKTLLRTCNVDGTVANTTYEDLRKLDAGSWFSDLYAGEKIPSLEEVFVLSKDRIRLMIELKEVNGNEQLIAQKICKLIDQYELQDDVIISSFSGEMLYHIKEENPEIATCLITSFAFGPVYEIDTVDSISISARYASKNSFQEADRTAYSIYVWTVNNQRAILNMKDQKVDGIITDYPIYARELLYENTVPDFINQLIENLFKIFP